MTRTYGRTGDVAVNFERRMISLTPTLIVIGQRDSIPKGAGKTSFATGDDGKVELRYETVDAANGDRTMLRLYPAAEMMPAVYGASEWTVGRINVRMSGTSAAMRVLDACATRLMTSWGIDPKLMFEGQVARLPENAGQYFNNASYPKDAKRLGIEGRVSVVLSAAPDGRVSGCKVLETTSEKLNVGTCEAAKRMKLVAPTGAENQPTASYTIMPVTWFLPR